MSTSAGPAGPNWEGIRSRPLGAHLCFRASAGAMRMRCARAQRLVRDCARDVNASAGAASSGCRREYGSALSEGGRAGGCNRILRSSASRMCLSGCLCLHGCPYLSGHLCLSVCLCFYVRLPRVSLNARESLTVCASSSLCHRPSLRLSVSVRVRPCLCLFEGPPALRCTRVCVCPRSWCTRPGQT